MGEDELKKKSITVNQKILNLINNLSNNTKIGLFYPYKNEVNVLLLAKTLEDKRKICLLPKVIAKNQPLKYFPYSHRAPFLEKGFGGIMEPSGQLSEDPDIIIHLAQPLTMRVFEWDMEGDFLIEQLWN